MKFVRMAALAACLAGSLVLAGAADWPQWRYDAGHSADSPERLSPTLQPLWSREYAPRTPAWDDPLNQDLMPYDAIFEPIVMGQRMFLAFNDRDKVVALDTRTGRELWAYYADGPVRLAPAAANGKVYFASDDGYLYCVRAADGTLVWKVRGGPSERKALGNRRLVSAWVARGGPVVRGKTVYFAASIWPFMGVFIKALDAETGQEQWVNDGTGSMYIKQPHYSYSFAGVAPQGILTATDKVLLVPGGRSIPAAFDRLTGAFLYYHLAESGKGNGGSEVLAGPTEFLVHTRQNGARTYDLKTGKKSVFTINQPVIGHSTYYAGSEYPRAMVKVVEAKQKLELARYNELKVREELAGILEESDEKAAKKAQTNWMSEVKRVNRYTTNLAALELVAAANPPHPVVQAWRIADKGFQWEVKADASGDLIRAGGRLYAAGSNVIAAIDPPQGNRKAAVAWTLPAPGQVRRLLAADGQLFAVTQEGHILAFGAAAGTRPILAETNAPPAQPAPAAAERAQAILAKAGTTEGYAFCLGLEDGELMAALAAASSLHVVGVDADAGKVERLRRALDAAGLYGTRIHLLAAAPDDFGAPPYIASVVVAAGAFAARLEDPAVARKVYESVRPYGGLLWVEGEGRAGKLAQAGLAKAAMQPLAGGVAVTRAGALPGSADWTHQYGDVANTLKSDDQTVRLPVGVLWFGGNTHQDVLPRHGHGPSPQVAGGRLVIEGMDCLSARDVYTGRRLWKTTIPGLDTFGIYHSETYTNDPYTTLYNQRHIPGANARGANYVLTEDRVYIAVSNHCAVLDAVTGKILKNIEMPARQGEGRGEWGYLGVYEDVLLGGVDFARFNRTFGGPNLSWPPPPIDMAACKGLVAFDRYSGEVLWKAEAKYSFFHNGIVAGKGTVFCLDRLPKSVEAKLRNKKEPVPTDYRIAAFDVRTGRLRWEKTNIVSCSWLGFAKEEDLLLLAGANATDRIKDETSSSMQVLQAQDGKTRWKRAGDLRHNGPPVLYHGIVLTTPTSYKENAGAFQLRDGKPHTITNALTGGLQAWKVYRNYGCNAPIAAEHLMTFRSGAAGFYDLENHAGTGNLGGFKSSCSANLIVANGVLNAPDYTRTCSCPYQNQTSLAFVPMPEVEMWTCNFSGLDTPATQRVARVGINLGAPGDFRATNGTVWVEYPANAGASPRLLVTINNRTFTNLVTNAVFRFHSSSVAGQGAPMVIASGLRDVFQLTITPQTLKPIPAPGPPSEKEDDDDPVEEKNTDNVNGKNASSANQVSGSAPNQLKDATYAAATNLSGSLTNQSGTATNQPGRSKGKGRGKNSEVIATSASLPTLEPATYTVRLYFLEPDPVAAGRRVFDVLLQGKTVLAGFDPVREADGSKRGVVKEFTGIGVTKDLEIRFSQAPTAALAPVLSGVELIQE